MNKHENVPGDKRPLRKLEKNRRHYKAPQALDGHPAGTISQYIHPIFFDKETDRVGKDVRGNKKDMA